MRVTDEMVLAGAREVCARWSAACGVDPEDNWKIYSDEHKAEARAILTAALSHAAGQDGEQCRAASGEAGELALTLERMADNAYCDYIRKMQRDECLGWEEKVRRGSFDSDNLRAHVGAGELLGRHRALHEAAKLLRALSRGVPEGDDSLPRPLWPVSKEWYRLCERRFAVDRITISGKLAEAIVDAVCGPAIAAQRKEG